MAWLTKDIADTICTTIAIGFMGIDGKATAFEYDKDGDAEDYVAVQNILKSLKIEIPVTKSKPQGEMPMIIARPKWMLQNRNADPNNPIAPDPNFDLAVSLAKESWKYIYLITQTVDQKLSDKKFEEAPRGAYIGGMSSISATTIIGPSDLQQYTPKYRAVDQSEIGDLTCAYRKANVAAENARDCLSPVRRPAGIKLELDAPMWSTKEAEEEAKTLKKGNVFKSYHGMVRAFKFAPFLPPKDGFIFEIALGAGTSKVSSCPACSMFMTASGMPATSTHLGRGDNWHIPDGTEWYTSRTAWQKKIVAYYDAGAKAIRDYVAGPKVPGEPAEATAVRANIDKVKRVLDIVRAKIVTESICDIFLEALTFEGSFTTKFSSTFGLPQRQKGN
jgi:hypothetical protein